MNSAGHHEFAAALAAVGATGMACEFHAELELGKDGVDLVVTLVNVSPGRTRRMGHKRLRGEPRGRCRRHRAVHARQPARLVQIRPHRGRLRRQRRRGTALGEPLRHRRRRASTTSRGPRTGTAPSGSPPDVTFVTLAADPIPSLRELVDAVAALGRRALVGPGTRRAPDSRRLGRWHAYASGRRSGSLPGRTGTSAPRARARRDRRATCAAAFRLANRSFAESPAIGHTRVATVPARLPARQPALDSSTTPRAASEASSTRSGSRRAAARPRPTSCSSSPPHSTTVSAASARASPRGAASRSACSRSSRRNASPTSSRPRNSSDARKSIDGDAFSLGFFVGDGGTPEPHPDEPRPPAGTTRPGRPRHARPLPGPPALPVLRLDRARDAVRPPTAGPSTTCAPRPDARGAGDHCPSGSSTRRSIASLPTVVLGTLDKAASISMQAAMRGFYGPPAGRCPDQRPRLHLRAAKQDAERLPLPRLHRDPGAARTAGLHVRPNNPDAGRAAPPPRQPRRRRLALRGPPRCAPDCTSARRRRSSPRRRRSPVTTNRSPPSTAARDACSRGRAPRPAGPSGRCDTDELARRFAGVAPRGVTLEYATDQLTEALQRVTRRAVDDPAAVAAEIGIDHRVLARACLGRTASMSSTAPPSRTSRRSPGPSKPRSSSNGR